MYTLLDTVLYTDVQIIGGAGFLFSENFPSSLLYIVLNTLLFTLYTVHCTVDLTVHWCTRDWQSWLNIWGKSPPYLMYIVLNCILYTVLYTVLLTLLYTVLNNLLSTELYNILYNVLYTIIYTVPCTALYTDST